MPLSEKDAARLADLKAKLDARTSGDTAKKGYKRNVAMIRTAIEILETKAGAPDAAE